MNNRQPTQPHLLQIGFSSHDIDASTRFFADALGFEPQERFSLQGGGYGQLIGLPEATLAVQRLQLGHECLEITQVLDPGPGQRPGRAIPAASRSCDLWFQHICVVTPNLDQAMERLQPALATNAASPISSAPQTLPEWNTAAAGIRAYKFHDPEGHNLELLEFPADKGDSRWHQASEPQQTALGLDHSAISVANTEASCRFYDALLGFQLGGDGVNSGPTQDGLDGLSETQVRITSHRCSSGAGIECLQYLPPNLGRPMPADLGFQDLAHWQIRIAVDDLNGIAGQLSSMGGRLLSPGIVDLGPQSDQIGARRGLQVADPDGHQLQLVQR